MPRLTDSRIPPITTSGEFEGIDKRPWTLHSTQEVFNIEEYNNKPSLHQQTVWECERTGKQNLTYEQALESERVERRVESRIPKALQKMILARVEFPETAELNEIVDGIWNSYRNNYFMDEIVRCTLNNNKYFARIVDVPIEDNHLIVKKEQPLSETPRQANGRLRFPDAFLQPSSVSESEDVLKENVYRVQLIDERGVSLEKYIRTVGEYSIKREKEAVNYFDIQWFIQKYFYRNEYPKAPWLIKPNTRLQDHLPGTQIGFVHNSKRQKTSQIMTIEERLMERQREEYERQVTVKYPLEDLDLPVYRKSPLSNWSVVDMTPQKYNGEKVIPNPCGGKPSRPIPHTFSTVPPELLDSFLSSWSFLTVFGEPLRLSNYSLDEFEQALLDTTLLPRPNILVEYNTCLLNIIINERNDDSVNDVIKGYVTKSYIDTLEEETDDDEAKDNSSSISILPRIERGWQDKEHLKISERWDHKEIRASAERKGWLTSLIGCLNDVATPDMIPELDEILQHIVPRTNSTAAEREKRYPLLSLKQKLDVLEFLVNTVTESNCIRNYIEHCQEQMLEHRKQKVEINKEMKNLYFKKIEMDRADHSKDKEIDDNLNDSKNGLNNSDDSESPHSQVSVRQSRQSQTKQQNKVDRRSLLEEEEKALKEKDEQLEVCLRKCLPLRMQPLGKDRFYNQYMYFDNIGASDTCGPRRLYVHSPCDSDIQILMDRDLVTDLPETHCGHGGGRWFILELMKEQGFVEEIQWLENRMDELNSDHPGDYQGWWKCYIEPEEIEKLLSWLNPKGTRELQLKKELKKQCSGTTDSIKKRTNVQS